MLQHWPLFGHSDLEDAILSCLLSWPDNAAAEHHARVKFIHACANAGILIMTDHDLRRDDTQQRIAATRRKRTVARKSELPQPPAQVFEELR